MGFGVDFDRWRALDKEALDTWTVLRGSTSKVAAELMAPRVGLAIELGVAAD